MPRPERERERETRSQGERFTFNWIFYTIALQRAHSTAVAPRIEWVSMRSERKWRARAGDELSISDVPEETRCFYSRICCWLSVFLPHQAHQTLRCEETRVRLYSTTALCVRLECLTTKWQMTCLVVLCHLLISWFYIIHSRRCGIWLVRYFYPPSKSLEYRIAINECVNCVCQFTKGKVGGAVYKIFIDSTATHQFWIASLIPTEWNTPLYHTSAIKYMCYFLLLNHF